MKNFLHRFRRDESGAAMVEYTVLLGIMLAITVATITAVGGKADAIWTAVNAAMPVP